MTCPPLDGPLSGASPGRESLNASACKSCGAEVVWMALRSGKAMILESKILTVYTSQGVQVRGREPHWAHCPEAAEWKQKEDR